MIPNAFQRVPLEPRTAAEPRGGADLLRPRAGTGQAALVGRALQRRWHADRSLGEPESFQKKDGGDDEPGQFRGQKRSNETHESKTDPEARLYRKGNGQESRLGYLGHVLVENRHGLVVDALLTQADGTAERDAALLVAFLVTDL